MNDLAVDRLRAEHRRGLGIGTATPRLSWTSVTDRPDWIQSAYEIEVDGTPFGEVVTDDSVLVPWPAAPLPSRRSATVRVRVWGTDGSASHWSDPLVVETGLLSADDWTATWITPATTDPTDEPAPVPHLRRSFDVEVPAGATIERARLHGTSAGVHRFEINGHRVGDLVLAPGWTSYAHRLRYDTHDVTDLLVPGPDNVLGAVVADGWWRGHLTWAMQRNVYGDRLGLLAQLEIFFSDGTRQVVTSDTAWRTTTGPIRSSDLYAGETHDARADLPGWSAPGFDDAAWGPVEAFEPTVGALVAPPGPPVRRTQTLPVQEVLTTPSGRTVVDFGQNLVGRVRFTVDGPAGTTVTLRHAEVLEGGEPAYEPLRHAAATDRYTLRGGGPETWEPEFTFHGFRYAEVIGWPGPLDPAALEAVVLHSDLERTGTFTCSHPLLDRLHQNVTWGMRGNFLDVPTDCPQRDERLGWTGDLQVFAPTATFLYDVAGMLGNWLDDLRADQRPDGSVPVIVPDLSIPGVHLPAVAAGWSDAAVLVPWSLYQQYGDVAALGERFASMRAWVDHVADRTGDRHLWIRDFQFGDWLDPTAPEAQPWLSRTDTGLVATAYHARTAQVVADAAEVLGFDDLAERYRTLAEQIAAAFRDEYVTPRSRVMSDTATAYALALRFDLVTDADQRARMGRNLARIVRASFGTITTGFLGTPLVLGALTDTGHLDEAYDLLTSTERPSWLYAVTMGATTIWERWDSLLPDGTVNGSGMTSFNHYAFGAVADWMHATIGGLASTTPGWRHLTVAPVPGPGIDRARATLTTPYGPASCAWSVAGTTVDLEVVVPPNATAAVTPPGGASTVEVGSGRHRWTYEVTAEVRAGWRIGDLLAPASEEPR